MVGSLGDPRQSAELRVAIVLLKFVADSGEKSAGGDDCCEGGVFAS